MKKKRAWRNYEATEALNVWSSFTDLMANAFMIISLFLLLALFKSLFLKYTADETELNLSETERQVRLLKREIATLENKLGVSTSRLKRLRRDSQNLLEQSNNEVKNLEFQIERLTRDSQILLQRSNSRINILESEVDRLKVAPPVVVIQDSGEYQFNSGSAQLPQELKNYISTELVDRIEEISQQRNLYVVEIIGHTDGQVNVNGRSNLDTNLAAVAQVNRPINELIPGSNVDLGLMRALEVVKQLQQVQASGRLDGVQFRAYSAAQLLLPSGEFAATTNRRSDSKRRRIEIRFSPIGKAETVR